MGKTRTVLLIDGDVEAFKAASVSQENIDWGGGDVSVDLDAKRAKDYLVSALIRYRDMLKADRMIICISGEDNWRKKLWPDYKANRKDVARPVLLAHCKKFLLEKYESACWPRLEADDVMGILSSTIKGSVIVSVDKDMRSIPCRLFNPGKPREGIIHIDEVEAHEWHMMQTLMGDSVDGFKGCPGVGQKTAEKIVREVFDAVNPIQNYSEWRSELWKRVVETYEAWDSTAESALLNARLAYILRQPAEYDKETARMRLWRPPT